MSLNSELLAARWHESVSHPPMEVSHEKTVYLVSQPELPLDTAYWEGRMQAQNEFEQMLYREIAESFHESFASAMNPEAIFEMVVYVRRKAIERKLDESDPAFWESLERETREFYNVLELIGSLNTRAF